MLVDLLCGGDVRVSEDQLDVAHWHAEVLQQRGGGVPRVVHRDAREVDRLADLVKGAHEVLGVNRSAGSTEEHQFVWAGTFVGWPSGSGSPTMTTSPSSTTSRRSASAQNHHSRVA